MKEIKIDELYEIEILKEMCSKMVNVKIKTEFYDYYFLNSLDWLLKNKEKITNDFESNLNKMRFDILVNSYNLYSKYGLMILKQVLKEGKEELKKYINLDYITIDEAYNNLIAKKSDYARFKYFTRIKKEVWC